MKLAALLLFSLLSLNIQASEPVEKPAENSAACRITGKVIEEITGESLTGVEIEILGTGKTVYTGFDGEFSIEGLDNRTNYSIQIQYVSFRKKIIRQINPGREEMIIRLQPETTPSNTGTNQSHPHT